MHESSMRGNILIGVSLYAVALVVAAGCPTAKERTSSEVPVARLVPTAIEAPVPAPAPHSLREKNGVFAKTPPSEPAPAQRSPSSEARFDPVKVNGEYFVGWPKPKLAILISGRQDGYLEPCGCAGLENQKGGLARRHALIEQLKEAGWPLVPLDVGNLVRRFGKQSEVQFAISAEALKIMGYRAAGFGPDDLRLSAGEVAAAVAGPDVGRSLFVSANASLFDLTPKVQIIEKNGVKVGVTAILGDTYREQINNTEIEFTPPANALSKVASKLAKCDVRILLAHATVDESIELAKQFPDFDFVVSADGGDEPPNIAKPIEGAKAMLIEVGHKGMYCVVLGLYDDEKEPVRYQRVALDSRFPSSPRMKQLMATYQEQLQDLGWSGLDLRFVAHPSTREGVPRSGAFVGAESCKECHSKAWEVWSQSPHYHATDSLEHADPPRQFDAECISCHATGWNPQEYFPYATGYDSLKNTPHLAGNQCENCHGPGGAHVAAETGDDAALRDAERQFMKLPYQDAAESCRKCHDLDNSPEFNFEEYWPQVEHIGKD